MKKIIVLMILTIGFAQDFEVDGNLKVQGNIIFSDNTVQSSVTEPYSGMSEVIVFTSTTDWVVPGGVITILVEMWGAGGGRGGTTGQCGTSSPQGEEGQYGGAGGYIKKFINVDQGQTYTITVGSGGAGGGSACTNWDQNYPDLTDGGDGGDSSFGSLNIAYGGHGGESAYNTVGADGAGGSGSSGFIVTGETGSTNGSAKCYGGTLGWGNSSQSGKVVVYY